MKKKPAGRTLAEFFPLHAAEQQLLLTCAQGTVAQISQNRPEQPSAINFVRAAFVRFLALGGDDEAPVHEHGVQLQGAWLDGVLDLQGAQVPFNLTLVNSHFVHRPECLDAKFKGIINFSGSLLPGWNADRMRISGDVLLRDGFKTIGEIRLPGAEIGGSLDCSGSTLDGINEYALLANGATIKGHVFLKSGFIATGGIRFLGTQIGTDLACAGARLDGKDKQALAADGATIKGCVFLNAGFTTAGEVRFLGAQIGGNLDCAGAALDGNNGKALSAEHATIKGNVFLREGFTAIEEVCFQGAQIHGNLNLSGAKLNGNMGKAFVGDAATIKGCMSLNAGFMASGEVQLLAAQIDCDLDCSDAKLDGKEYALAMDGATIKGCVFFNPGFISKGGVRLLGAQIGGDLECGGAILDGNNGKALSADNANIKGNVSLNKGFSAIGDVLFLSAQIGGNLECADAKFSGKTGGFFSIEHIRVDGILFIRNMTPPQCINLMNAFVGRLVDDSKSLSQYLILDGFVYGSFTGSSSTDAPTRLVWLDKQTPEHSGLNGKGAQFKPQPWRQLQKVLRDMGHTEDARQVAIAFENRMRQTGLIGQAPQQWSPLRQWGYKQLSMGFHWFFRILIGYGFRPIRLIWWILGVWLFCAAVYWYAALQGVMAPSNPLVFQNADLKICQDQKNWYLCKKLPEEYTGFSPLAYSMDLILPLVNLQQENDWAPLIPTPKASVLEEFGWPWSWSLNYWTRWLIWFEILFGWIASLLLVAVVSGLTKRRED